MQLIKCHLLKTSSDADVCELYQARSEREKMATQSSNPVVKGTWRPTVELEPLLNEAKARKMIRGAQTGTAGLGLAPERKKENSKKRKREE